MRNNLTVILGLFLLIGFAVPVDAQEPMRVMTYNLRYNNPDDGVNAWPNRKDAVAEMIGVKYKVDLAGMQEALKGQIDDLVQRLPDFAWIGVGREDGKEKGEYSPIFYRKTRFELIQTQTFWLSETPEAAGSRSWDAALPRIVTWGKFKEKVGGKIFYAFNTHFDHKGEKAREESAKLMWKRIAAVAGETPTIVTGDFNSFEKSPVYAILTGKVEVDGGRSDLKDGRYISEKGHEGPTSTMTDWKKYGPPESKIDYIFARKGISILTHKVLEDRYNGDFPSDHLPVLAELRLP